MEFSSSMDRKERKILQLRFGLALIHILDERKAAASKNRKKGIKEHQRVASLRKLSAGSGIEFSTVQKISKGDQGLAFFTFIDLIDALEMDMISFGKYFHAITPDEIKAYQAKILQSRAAKKKK